MIILIFIVKLSPLFVVFPARDFMENLGVFLCFRILILFHIVPLILTLSLFLVPVVDADVY